MTGAGDEVNVADKILSTIKKVTAGVQGGSSGL